MQVDDCFRCISRHTAPPGCLVDNGQGAVPLGRSRSASPAQMITDTDVCSCTALLRFRSSLATSVSPSKEGGAGTAFSPRTMSRRPLGHLSFRLQMHVRAVHFRLTTAGPWTRPALHDMPGLSPQDAHGGAPMPRCFLPGRLHHAHFTDEVMATPHSERFALVPRVTQQGRSQDSPPRGTSTQI